jgi:hypothetical protein
MKAILAFAFLALPPLAFASSADAGSERSFVGLWQGIDPLDGGPGLHSITCFRDETCQLIAADEVVSFCGGEPASIGGTGGLEDDDLVFPDAVITCRDNRVVTIELSYARDRRNRTLVAAASAGAAPVRTIVLHKISR